MLRSQTFTKQWKNPDLNALLKELLAGSGIELHPDITEPKLTGNFVLNAQTALEAFEELKKSHVLTSYFIEDELHCGLEATVQTNSVVKYRLDWNTVKDNQLKCCRAQDAKVQVNVKYFDKKRKERHFKAGPAGGIVVTQDYKQETDLNALGNQSPRVRPTPAVGRPRGKSDNLFAAPVPVRLGGRCRRHYLPLPEWQIPNYLCGGAAWN